MEAYDIIQLTSDVVGLIDALKVDKAVLIGHDWGAMIVWATALLHPKRVSGVVGVSVPAVWARWLKGKVPFLDYVHQQMRGRFLYVDYFQEEGIAEKEFGANTAATIRKGMYFSSGDFERLGLVNKCLVAL